MFSSRNKIAKNVSYEIWALLEEIWHKSSSSNFPFRENSRYALENLSEEIHITTDSELTC